MGRRKQRHLSTTKRASVTVDKNIETTDVLKSLNLGVQSVSFMKDRFLSFTDAAAKAEAMGLDMTKHSETPKAFIFDQKSAASFADLSLRKMEIEAGIVAMVGVSLFDSAPELPHDAEAVSHPKQENQDVHPESSEPKAMDDEPELVEVTAEMETEAFDEVEATQSLGYAFLSMKQAEQLTGLKTEFAAQVQALKTVADTIAPTVTAFIDDLIEKSGENHALVGLLDRVNTGLVLLDDSLSKLDLGVEVNIDKGLSEELAKETEESTILALKTLQDVIAPVVELFHDTSFDKFHSLCKSVQLSTTRLTKEFLNIDKALMPTDEMTRDELRESQSERSKRWGIEVVGGSALTFPSGFPEDLADYGDPVNLKFPFDTAERARNARVRFKQFADDIYKEDQSKATIHERIVRRELEFGITVRIDEDDALDQLLPSELMNAEGVEVISKKKPWPKDEKKTTKSMFIPICKQSEEERTVLGIVLEPDVVDLHGDTYDEDTVQKAAWFFMEEMQNIGKNHTQLVSDKVSILESYATPADMDIETPMGRISIKQNTWMMRVRVKDNELWEEVKTGELTGFSIGALVTAETLGDTNE